MENFSPSGIPLIELDGKLVPTYYVGAMISKHKSNGELIPGTIRHFVGEEALKYHKSHQEQVRSFEHSTLEHENIETHK